jgi:hypothetical protein
MVLEIACVATGSGNSGKLSPRVKKCPDVRQATSARGGLIFLTEGSERPIPLCHNTSHARIALRYNAFRSS